MITDSKFNRIVLYVKNNYGIDLSQKRLLVSGRQPITEIPEVEDYIKGLINLRGKIIPVIDVQARFKMEPREGKNGRYSEIIVRPGKID